MMLKELALLGAMDSRIAVSSSELGERMGISQQSASRLMRWLRDSGFIDVSRGRKSWVIITAAGKRALAEEYADYLAIFGGEDPSIKGTVESGLGEGGYYLSRKEYVLQIEELLGFTPYPGTLNIRLEPVQMARYRHFLSGAVLIKGFVSEGRTFGDVVAVRAEIGGMRCAAITPKRSHYSDVIEIIAPVKLRDALNLRDGDEVEMRVV